MSCPKKQDTFVPLSSHVKSFHGSQDRRSQTAEHILTICTKPFYTPVLVGCPPGGVLEIRQLLLHLQMDKLRLREIQMTCPIPRTG